MGKKNCRSPSSTVKWVLISLLVAILAFAINNKEIFESKTNIKAALTTCYIQLSLLTNVFFGGALLADGFSGDGPPVKIDIGYHNNLQLKFIWLTRFFVQDQFLFVDWEKYVFGDIESRLRSQYERENYPSLDLKIDTINWDDIDHVQFLDYYVRRGVPVVIKNFKNEATGKWSAEYFAKTYPNHNCEVINTSSVTAQRETIADFFAKSSQGAPLYLRSLSNIFDVDPKLIDEVGLHAFDKYMEGPHMTSQIFMNTGRKNTGTSYHCANYNNVFFMVKGRKRWTFVDPNYTPLLYPMYNAKSMDMASFVTTVALANETMMDTYFPLYKLIPKITVVLEPGDVLMNPQFNWHMVENLDSETIGVATRWFFPSGHVYQNSLHSLFQWFSTYMWKTYYTRIRNRALNITAHTASNTPPMDERFNYGRKGSSINFEPKIFPKSFYEAQGEFGGNHIQGE